MAYSHSVSFRSCFPSANVIGRGIGWKRVLEEGKDVCGSDRLGKTRTAGWVDD